MNLKVITWYEQGQAIKLYIPYYFIYEEFQNMQINRE